MGLDMYVERVYRPKLRQNRYTAQQLNGLGHSYMAVDKFNEAGAAMCELRHFCAKVVVEQAYYDLEKIIADYNLPKDSYIGMWSANGIAVCGKRGDEHVRQEISIRDIDEKYTILKDEECYVWHSDEVAYWRKAYDKQSAWYEILGRDVENCGYYELTEDDIREFRKRFPDDENDFECDEEDAALFYHEWY